MLIDINNIENTIPNNYLKVKAYYLETVGGWKTHIIYYEEWMKKYPTKDLKENFLKSCI